jgi:hypothetical protein
MHTQPQLAPATTPQHTQQSARSPSTPPHNSMHSKTECPRSRCSPLQERHSIRSSQRTATRRHITACTARQHAHAAPACPCRIATALQRSARSNTLPHNSMHSKTAWPRTPSSPLQERYSIAAVSCSNTPPHNNMRSNTACPRSPSLPLQESSTDTQHLTATWQHAHQHSIVHMVPATKHPTKAVTQYTSRVMQGTTSCCRLQHTLAAGVAFASAQPLLAPHERQDPTVSSTCCPSASAPCIC